MPAKKTTKKKTATKKKPVRKVSRAKKPVARKVAKKKVVKRATPKVSARKSRVAPVKNKTKKAVQWLIFFGIVFGLSVVLASLTSNEFLDEILWIVALVSAALAVTFLIVLLALVFLRQIKKK